MNCNMPNPFSMTPEEWACWQRTHPPHNGPIIPEYPFPFNC